MPDEVDYIGWHFCFHTLGSWLHGDPRGFRSRGHRIHSSGDYRNPPPTGEHVRLHGWQQQRSRRVELPEPTWPAIRDAMREKCEREAWPLDALSVGPTHVHALVHLPKPALRESSSEGRDDASAYKQAKHIAGRLKQAASHAVREHLPGKIWSQGGVPKRIRDATHLSEARRYIHDHRKQRCLVWVADHVHIPER